MGAVDQVTWSLVGAVEDAQVVIIATPTMAVKEVMEIIGPRLTEGCLVTDTGGPKGVVIEWAERYLPQNVNFVGGHPVVGKEGSGPETADGSLFQNRPYGVIPGKRAERSAVRLLTDMIQSIGAKSYFMDPGEHDSFMCAVSHLPLLLSVALVGCTSKSPSWDDIAKMASLQYRDLTRLASDNPASSRDIVLSNDQGMVYWIDALIQELYEIRQILAGGEEGRMEALDKVFSQAFDARAMWIAGAVTPASPAAVNRDRLPSAMEGMGNFFMGDSEARRRVFGSLERA